MRIRTFADTNLRTNKFIDKANNIHNNQYDYSQMNYVNSYTPVEIICATHGSFLQRPRVHLEGGKCPSCLKTNRADTDKRTSKFIETAKQVHGDKYDYSDIIYVNSYTPVRIICKIHGPFVQTPTIHINSKSPLGRAAGCQQCATAHRNTNLTKFIQQSQAVHGDYYDYSHVDLIGVKDKVEIICPKHGRFVQIATQHMSGRECHACAWAKRTTTLEQFIEKCRTTHGNKYDYSNTNYINCHTKVDVMCPAHGVFSVDPVLHWRRTGCPSCNVNYSKGNQIIKHYLQEHKIEFIEEHRFDDCRSIYPLPFDFYVKSHNLLIEFDGKHHTAPVQRSNKDTTEKMTERFELTQKHDNIKNEYAKKNDIKLLRIPYQSFSKLTEILSDALLKAGRPALRQLELARI